MKKTNLKEKLQNWKLGNYFRELSIVTAGVFITLAGTDFINSASQEKQINKSMQMIKMELAIYLTKPAIIFIKIITVFMKYGQPDYKNMISNN